jgi:hypothetical protein
VIINAYDVVTGSPTAVAANRPVVLRCEEAGR